MRFRPGREQSHSEIVRDMKRRKADMFALGCFPTGRPKEPKNGSAAPQESDGWWLRIISEKAREGLERRGK